MAAVMAGGMIPAAGHWAGLPAVPDAVHQHRALLAPQTLMGATFVTEGRCRLHCAIRCGSASPASQAVHWPGS